MQSLYWKAEKDGRTSLSAVATGQLGDEWGGKYFSGRTHLGWRREWQRHVKEAHE